MERFMALDEQGRDDLGRSWCLPSKNGDGTWTPGEWMPVASMSSQPDSSEVLRRRYWGATEDGLLGDIDSFIYRMRSLGEALGSWTTDKGGLLSGVGTCIYQVESSSFADSCDAEPLRDEPRRRLLRAMNWDASVARSFACDCAEHVLPVFELMYPGDGTLHSLLAASRGFISDRVSRSELDDVLCKVSDDLRKHGELRGPVLDGQPFLPLYEFAGGAADAAVQTASASPWTAAAGAARAGQQGSMGFLTKERVAAYGRAIKEWEDTPRYRSWVGRWAGEEFLLKNWCKEHRSILDGGRRWRRYESRWQFRLLSRYLYGRVAPH